MKKNEEGYNKFWFGFAVGSAFCGLAAMAVGTKQGRTFIKKSIDYMESVDGSSDQIHQITSTLQEFTQTLLDSSMTSEQKAANVTSAVSAIVEEVIAPPRDSQAQSQSKKSTVTSKPQEKAENTLDSIIDKMRNFSTNKKTEARFFKKVKK